MAQFPSMHGFVALGSNLGDREAMLRRGLAALGETPRVRVVAVSRVYETAPEPSPIAQGPYLNAVVEVETDWPARALLTRLLEIEAGAGRERGPERALPRTLDLDLLLLGDERIDEPDLVVPHPRLARRPFVLEPLAELAAELRHPALPASIGELAARVRNPAGVRLFKTAGPWP